MRTLLLADDNVTVQRVITLTFAREPVRVVTASDGHQAMDRVVVDRPDIVLAGTTLPQVNGYELARFVKGKAGLQHVPVLLLSGAFETVDDAQLKSSGANGIIEKPVEPMTVINRVKELLGIKSDEDAEAPVPGRLVTPAGVSDSRPATPLPTVPRVVTSTRPMPPTEPRADALSPAEAADRGGDYFDSLESAFDKLDQKIAGHLPTTVPTSEAPTVRAASKDPRSSGQSSPEFVAPGNPVYEIDDEWFADTRAPDDKGAPVPPDAAAPPAYELDDEWFAEDQKAREARELEQRHLAAEMGIHEVAHPSPVPGVPEVPEVPEVRVVPEVPHASAATTEVGSEPVPRALPIDWFAMGGSASGRQPGRRPAEGVSSGAREQPEMMIASVAPIAAQGPDGAPTAAGRVADDFAALLAFERGEKAAPPMIEPTIHVVTPEITPEMLGQIASAVADRLAGSIRVEPRAPEITDEMLELMAVLVAGRLNDSISVEPKAPELTTEMLETIAVLTSRHLRDQIHVEPAAPVLTDGIVDQMAARLAERLADRVHVEPKAPDITGEMLDRLAGDVAARLAGSVRVEPVAPHIDDGMLERIAGTLADRLRDTVRVEAPAPELNDGHLERIAGTVADRLRDSVHVEARPPEITDAMLARVSESVAARLAESIRVEPAIPELNGSMLDQIADTVAARLSETVRDSVRVETVAPEVTGDMLEHIAHRVSERLVSSLPSPPPPPQISDEMLDRVAARVAERLQNAFSIDGLRDSITAAIRDTVRAVVSDTSERLVREEIERIKAKMK